MQWRHKHRGAEANGTRAGRDVGCQDEGRPEAVARKMMLRKPGAVESEFFTILDLLRGLAHDPVWIDAFWPGTCENSANCISSSSMVAYSRAVIISQMPLLSAASDDAYGQAVRRQGRAYAESTLDVPPAWDWSADQIVRRGWRKILVLVPLIAARARIVAFSPGAAWTGKRGSGRYGCGAEVGPPATLTRGIRGAHPS